MAASSSRRADVAPRQLTRFLKAVAAEIGDEWVFDSATDVASYQDVFALGDPRLHSPAGAVAPLTAAQVQTIVRLANRFKVPLWTISRGKNFGYGGAAPVMRGVVILDLTRMKRIIDVDEKLAYCVIEPGVGFYDLHAYLRANGIRLWMSCLGNSLGSVIGNALEHGTGITPYADHAMNLCGMELVMPDGDIVRTGMGAMDDNPTWHLSRHGYGPGWEQMFTQSNFGVVTRAGMWLMPEPEGTLSMTMNADKPEDIRWIVDTLGELRTKRIITQATTVRNYMRWAALDSVRSDWYDGPGAMPDEVIERIRQKYGVGWWNINFRLYELPEVNDAHARFIEEKFKAVTDNRFEISRWRQGDPPALSGESLPGVGSMQMVNWAGGRGGHVGFSPVLPLNGELAFAQFDRTRVRMKEFGFDYYGSMYLWERAITVISQIFFDRDDAQMLERVHGLFRALIADAAQNGYGEYRTHIDFMDDVARSFAFNNHALLRWNEKLKDALDPNGILSPGKQGIWPARYREEA
ncbi:MAG: FAD-dependent oxidoreductase [Gammaproteobacteria bacterium]|nr:FAD-dependent oxidoreductase [Gammaproteobacteria bacterium]